MKAKSFLAAAAVGTLAMLGGVQPVASATVQNIHSCTDNHVCNCPSVGSGTHQCSLRIPNFPGGRLVMDGGVRGGSGRATLLLIQGKVICQHVGFPSTGGSKECQAGAGPLTVEFNYPGPGTAFAGARY